jgi:Flp pilus assembly protein TadG
MRAGMLAVARSVTASVTRTCPTRRDDGAAAVEMALVLPLLLFVLFGLVDFGRLLNAQITLTEAAREGARAAALGQDADTRVKAAATNLSGVTTGPVTQCPTDGSTSANAVVTASAPFSFVTPLAALAPLFGGSLNAPQTLTGRGIMPCVG